MLTHVVLAEPGGRLVVGQGADHLVLGRQEFVRLEEAVGIGLLQAIPHGAHAGGEGGTGEVAQGIGAFGDEARALAEVGIFLGGLGDGRQGVEVSLEVAGVGEPADRIGGFLVGLQAQRGAVGFASKVRNFSSASFARGRLITVSSSPKATRSCRRNAARSLRLSSLTLVQVARTAAGSGRTACRRAVAAGPIWPRALTYALARWVTGAKFERLMPSLRRCSR